MGLFWPAHPKVTPNTVERLGRVVHWITIVLGIGFLGLVLTASGNMGAAAGPFLLFGVVLACGAVLLGRALRYILAGE